VPQPPLSEAYLNRSLVEYFKFMLNAESFVASCINEAAFLGLLPSTSHNGIDHRGGSEIVSVLDLDTAHPARYEFRATFRDAQPASLRICDCGGAPGYLSVWDRAALLANKVQKEEKVEQSAQNVREMRILLIAAVEVLAKLVYKLGDDGARREVVDVEILETDTAMKLGWNAPPGGVSGLTNRSSIP
jgi:hypothetical protein